MLRTPDHTIYKYKRAPMSSVKENKLKEVKDIINASFEVTFTNKCKLLPYCSSHIDSMYLFNNYKFTYMRFFITNFIK